MDRELETAIVFIDEAADLDEIVLFELIDGFGDAVPHLGFDLASAVSQGKRKVRVAVLLRLYLLGSNNEGGRDVLVLTLGGLVDKEFFHVVLLPESCHSGDDRRHYGMNKVCFN